jgi:protein SCO1/2
VSLCLRGAIALALLLGVAQTGTAQAPEYGQTEGRRILQDIGLDQRLGEALPLDVQFKDEDGQVVPLRKYFGERPVVLALVYYECPMLCTQVLNGLTKSLKALNFTPGKEFEVVVVSFDPKETPALATEKKKSYLARYGRPDTAGGWHFLTGSVESIEAVTKAVGFRYKYDPKSAQYAHASGIMLATPDGLLARYFYGIDYPTRDLRLGIVEASEERIGSPVDQILLLCFHYDPSTGKYSLAVMSVIRTAGVATVAGIAGFLIFALRRDRRKVAPAAELEHAS